MPETASPPAPAAAPPQASAPRPPVRSLWKLLWPRIRPYRYWIALSMLFNAAHGVAISFQTLMPKYLIDDVVSKPGLSTRERWHRCAWLVLAYLAASLLGRMAVWHIGYRIFTHVRERVLYSLRLTFFTHVNDLCLRFHRRNSSGELFNYLFGTPLGNIQQYFQQFTNQAPGAVFILVWTIGWVARWDWPMTGVLALTVTASTVALNLSRSQMRSLYHNFQKTEGDVSGYVADLLRATRDVKLFALEDRVRRNFADRADLIGRKSYERDIKVHIQWMKQETVGYFCFALLCVVGVWRYLGRHVTIGELQGYLSAFIALQGPLQQLFQVGTLKNGAMASLERIEAVLGTVSSTPDPAGPAAAVPAAGEIRCERLCFRYEEKPILRDIDLTIPYGQWVAVVGPSGSGKTTLFQLLLRLYDPESGAIRLDGTDLRAFRSADLRRKFGVVPQDPFIFNATIRENLQVIDPGADGDRLRRACELANAWEFIARLPKGLDTPVGEGGATLSGGQRQRLAIARALLTDPAYFIFDEATSALDTISEQLIQKSLETAMEGRTALIIAHRLATVKNCDRVLVLDQGRIAQDGTYAELAGRPGLLADLVAGQQLRF